MKCYFYSPVPLTAVSGDRVLGVVDRNVSFSYLDDDALIRLCAPDIYPAIVGKNYLQNATAYYFYYGKLFVPKIKRLPLAYSVVCQKRIVANGREIIATLLNDGSRKMTVEMINGLVTLPVGVVADKINLIDCGNCLLAEASGKMKHVFLLSYSDLKITYSTVCFDYEIKDVLVIKRVIGTYTRYLVTEHYKITDTATLLGTDMLAEKDASPETDMLICYDFLHLIKYGGRFESYFSEELKAKSNLIKNFLGEYDVVLPPIEKDFPSTFAIVGKSGVKYVDFSLENGKICDVDCKNSPQNESFEPN